MHVSYATRAIALSLLLLSLATSISAQVQTAHTAETSEHSPGVVS
jgi:hypothetical protein